MGDVSTLSIDIVKLDASMAADLEHIERLSFPMANPDDLLTAEDIEAYSGVFPEGYFVAMFDGRPVGQGAGIYLDFDSITPNTPWLESQATISAATTTLPASGSRSLLDNAVAQIGGQARHSQGRGFATPWAGMAGPRTQRVVMHGRQDG